MRCVRDNRVLSKMMLTVAGRKKQGNREALVWREGGRERREGGRKIERGRERNR